MQLTRVFSEISKQDVGIAGGKGASLGEMAQAGIPVPPGFVILSGSFDRFLEESDLNVEIDSILNKVDHKEIHTIEDASEKIKALIMGAEMPEDIAKDILKKFKGLKAKFVAVRSSATSEDSSTAAWAGQLESYLNTTEKDLLDNVKRCWASLFTPRAIFYRFEKGLHNEKVSVAVVVQEMVNSESSGVAFSVHPVTQDRNQIIIEAGYGLGEAIVSGQITPDSYVIHKNDQKIIDKNVNEQGKMLIRSKSGGNEWVELTKEKATSQVLSEKDIILLAKLISRIESHYKFPVDVEWAMEKGKFYIVQSRPITTLMPEKADREVMVSHRSDLITQDLILKGIFQYAKFRKFGASFDFPLIRYEHSTGEITYPVNQIEELRNLNLTREKFEELTKYLKEEISDYKKYIKKLEEDVKTGSRKKEKIIKYFDKTLRAVSVVPYFAFELSLHNLLEKEGISPADIPSTATYASRSSEELSKIADKYREELSEKKSSFSPGLRKELKGFCDKFGYLGMQYFGGQPWTVEGTYDLLFSLKDQKPIKLEKPSKKEASSPYVKIASDLLYSRTQNWELMCYGCYLFRKFITEQFPELDYEKVLGLRIDELLEIIEGRAGLKDKYVIRKKFILEIRNDGVFLEEEGEKKEEKIDYQGGDLQGVSAQPGKAKGKVRIVLTPKECGKVDVGDILVAVMSTPDFLPAMHKASAFVTDIGGITSHAAIVAREMKKPCVIGTKIATKVLHDGDLVEVDANQGIVRILKKVEEKKDQKEYDLTFKEFFPIFWDYQWVNNQYQKSFGRIIGKNPESISLHKHGELTKFWPKGLSKSLSDSLLPNLNPSWARKELSNFENDLNRFTRLVNQLEKTHSKLSWNDLSKKLLEVLSAIETVNGYSNGFYFVSIACEDKLRHELEKKGKSREEINSILLDISSSQMRPTILARYKEDISKVAKQLLEESGLNTKKIKEIADKELWSLVSKKAKTEKKLEDLYSKYHWFLSFSIDKIRDKGSFIQDILSAMKSEESNTKTLGSEIPQDLLPYAEILKVSGYIKDEASSFTIPYVWYKLRGCWQKVMDHHGLNLKEFQQLTEDEMLIGNLKSEELRKLAEQRYECAVLKCDDKNGVTIIVGDDANSIFEKMSTQTEKKSEVNVEEITGIPANKGIVKGSVKVVHKSSEISGFPEGAVLVTSYTAPEFVPAMKKAIAIITDTGGLTSHAAIISRELNKPCIIGTKVATQVLHDGDIIEVDADKGIVKILKKEEQIILTKLYTRERGLFLNYVEHMSTYDSGKAVFGIKNLIYVNNKGITTYWYDMNEVAKVVNSFGERINDPKFYKSILKEYETNWSKVADYMTGKKQIESIPQLKKLSEDYFDFLNYSKIIQFSTDIKELPESFRKESTKLREFAQEFSERMDGIIKDFIKRKFKEYESMSDCMLPEEIIGLGKSKLSSGKLEEIKKRKEEGYVIFRGGTYTLDELNSLLEKSNFSISQHPEPNVDKIKLARQFTREKSLFYAYMWDRGDKEIFEQLTGIGETYELFLNEGGSNKFTIYWPSGADLFHKSIFKKIQSDKDFFDKTVKDFYKYWKILAPYAQGKKISSMKELEEFYHTKLKWWAPLAILFNIPNIPGVPEVMKKKALKAREETQEYSDLGDEVFLEFFSKNYPEYKNIGWIISPEEVFSLKNQRFSKDKLEEIRKRLEGYFILDGKVHLLNQLDDVLKHENLTLEEIKEEASEIKGTSAYRGKVRGKVRLVLYRNEISTVSDGEIIVTEMTSPDFLPAMKKAAAFVTNEGGITCHAAIVSRELKKPCIIGTKIATHVLKNGDLVEVDADKGIVKILNKGEVKTLVNVFSREKSLIYFGIWDDSDRKGMEIIGEKIKNNLFIIPSKGKKGAVWYERSELENLKEKTLEKLKTGKDNPFWEAINSLSKKSWKFLEPYAKNKKTIKTEKEFEEYYDNLVDFWVCLNSILYEILDNKKLDMGIKKNLSDFRDKTEKYTEQMSLNLTDYLENNPKLKAVSYVITKKEALSILKGKTSNEELQEFKKRLNGCFMLNGKVYLQNELDERLNEAGLSFERMALEAGELKGNSAYPGIVKGRVKVVDGFKDLDKVGLGDILVTQMTNPKYSPAMIKSSGVITDQGGTLCHAAITAREMKKPCIIGTKIATKVLHDGDLVEVDADKGIVRILKKEEKEYEPIFKIAQYNIFLTTLIQKYAELFKAVMTIDEGKFVLYVSKGDLRRLEEEGYSLALDKDFYKNFKKESEKINQEVLKFNKIDLNKLDNGGFMSFIHSFLDLCMRFEEVYAKTEFVYFTKIEEEIRKAIAGKTTIDKVLAGKVNIQNWESNKRKLAEYMINMQHLKLKIREDLNIIMMGDDSISNKLMDEMVRRTKREDSVEMLTDELRDCLLGKKVGDVSGRHNASFIRFDNGWKIETGKEALENIEQIRKELPQKISGAIACMGVAKGIVKVIPLSLNPSKYLGKMNKGDILVADTTGPELVIACKKAAAIITDEGGQMSHAAVISRELNIPCIVGTKFATQMLKDGDLVEVDADKGIVRILKKGEKDDGGDEKFYDLFRGLIKFATRPMTTQRDELGAALWVTGGKGYFVSLPFVGGSRSTYTKKSEADRIYKELVDKEFGSEESLKKHLEDYEIFMEDFKKAAESVEKASKGSMKDCAEAYKLWLETFDKWTKFFTAPFAIEKMLDSECRALMKEEFGEKSDELIGVIFSPSKISDFQKMRIEIDDAVMSGKGNFKEIASRYYWYNEYSYVEPLLDESHFRNEAAKLTKEQAKQEKSKIEEDLRKNKKEFDKLMKRIKNKRLRLLAKVINDYAFIRSDRIEHLKRCQVKIRLIFAKIAEEFSKRSKEKWTANMVAYCLNDELLDFLFKGQMPNLNDVRERIGQNYLYYNTSSAKVTYDPAKIEKAKRIIEQEEGVNTEIKGTVAFKGKASGMVSTVFSKTDIPKVKPGDVLVAKTTMPDYTPAMKIASAFVTEEGGITSHAAIISRELKKPCIVGTGNCTKVLHDGDLVEVDADKGIVRIIKKEEGGMKTDILSDVNLWRFWGRWKSTIFSTFEFNSYASTNLFKKLALPPGFSGQTIHMDGYLYALEEDHKIFERFLTEKFNNDHSWFDNFFRYAGEIESRTDKLKRNKDIVSCMDLVRDNGCITMLIHFCDKSLERIVPQVALSSGLSSEQFAKVMVPFNPTYTMKYKTALGQLKKNKLSISSFLKDFDWVGSGYLTGKRLTESDIKKELEKFHEESEPSPVNLKSLNPHVRSQIIILQKLIYFRSLNAELLSKMLNSQWEALDELAKQYGLSRADFCVLTPNEIASLAQGGGLPADTHDRIRQNGLEEYGMSSIGGKTKIYLGDELKKALKVFGQKGDANQQNIPGTIAFKGKVQGVVKIVESRHDLQKINEGDIIVAPETMPDYIVGMKKAAAFVTNQGGITSHAAIVARELKKPCIIGTKNATKVLHDGDLVEVDADKGIVRILKKA